MPGTTNLPAPRCGPPLTCRTKLLEVVSEDVLPSDRLNRPFLLLYLPWRSQEGTRVESREALSQPSSHQAQNCRQVGE